MTETLRLIRVDPQPTWIESSGRWRWPLPESARFAGCCTEVVSASREWWEYAPSEAKPHPLAEGVELRDGVWYWAVPERFLGEEGTSGPLAAVGIEFTPAQRAMIDQIVAHDAVSVERIERRWLEELLAELERPGDTDLDREAHLYGWRTATARRLRTALGLPGGE